jgi:hypothetical protein
MDFHFHSLSANSNHLFLIKSKPSKPQSKDLGTHFVCFISTCISEIKLSEKTRVKGLKRVYLQARKSKEEKTKKKMSDLAKWFQQEMINHIAHVDQTGSILE